MPIRPWSAIALLALTIAVAANGLTAEAASAADTAGDTSTQALVDRALDAVGQGAESTADWKAPDAVDPSALPQTAGGDVGVTPADTDDSLVRVAPGETQAVTVLRDGADVTSFDLDLPDGFRAVPRGAGFDIVAALGSSPGSITAGRIADPWAVDADGHPIPTRFALEGDTLVQTIDAEGAAYPVVVDPLVTFGLANAPQGVGPYVNLLGSQMREIAAVAALLLSAGYFGICKAAGRLAAPAAKLIGWLCAAIGSPNVFSIVDLVHRIYQSNRFGFYACYQTRIGSGRAFVWTEHANCA
ncbi:hypothetical protein [Clavibacter michiganensis]|uniref:hypothetical protein n=1 Tax=Clavibacter michiganensis TaxID=28447 RepID=UPI003EB7D6CF